MDVSLRRLILILGLATGTAVWNGALAAQSTISSDRPGIGSGSYVMEAGLVQLEVGAAYSSSSAGSAYSLGQALVRIGVPGVEVQLFGNSWVVARSDTPSASDTDGLQDLALGVKVPVAESLDGGARFSVQGILTTPTGSDGFSSDEWIPALNALIDLSLSERAALAVNLGYQAGPGPLDDVFGLILTPGLSLDGGFGVYGGWAGSFSSGGNAHFAEGGLTWLASNDMQFDLNGGIDVDSNDWFFGAGVAIRRGAR